jgi:hypothetical protein
MSVLGRSRLGTSPLAGDAARAAPTVVVTAPTGVASATPVVVTWSYSSPVGRGQQFRRIRILDQAGETVVYDSGRLPGSATSFTIPAALSGGSSYLAEVVADDGLDASPAARSAFFFDGVDVSDFPANPKVGSVYEIAVNGMGLMLADHPDRETRYERRVVPLDTPRLATGDTPFSQAVDRYSFIGKVDWSGGSGQKLADRDQYDPAKYWRSNGINPFEPGELRLLPSTVLRHSSASPTLGAVVADGKLWVSQGDGTIHMYSTTTDTVPDTFTIAGAGAQTDFWSDGDAWYYADGVNIYRGVTAASVAAWSALDARVGRWCSDRVVVAYRDTGSPTANVVSVLNTAGAEVGTPQKWTFQPGLDVQSITSGDGWVWWAANRPGVSSIFGWKLGSTDSYITALELPQGQEAASIGFYLGNVFIRVKETNQTGVKAVIYRAAAQDGRLTPTRVLAIDRPTVDHSQGDFAGDDRYVYFSWREMESTSGIGCIDLSTGGWAKWLKAPSGTGAVAQIAQWDGLTVFTVAGVGAVIEQQPGVVNDLTVDEGQIDSSTSDLGTSLRKVFSQLSISFDPLPNGSTIQPFYSTDGGGSFRSLPAVTTPGEKFSTWALDAESDNITVRVKMTHTTTTTPVIRSITVKAHPVGLADQVLVLPVNCADQVTGLNNRMLPENGPGHGSARARTLEALVQTRVKVQDIDWPTTRVEQVYEVVAADVRSVGVFETRHNRQGQAQVCTLTLRRALR